MHNMRRARQQLSHEDATRILERATSGVLAVTDDGGWPYAVPLSFVHDNGRLYFHSAPAGHKIDAIRHCDRASFCVIDEDEVVPEEFTTYFRSTIAFGNVHIVESRDERMHALELLGKKYSPGLDDALAQEIDTLFARTCVLRLDIERLTGKEAIELVREREKREERPGQGQRQGAAR